MRTALKRASRSLYVGVAAVTMALVSGGCDLPNELAADLNDPVKRHPVGFASNNEALLVEIVPGTKGLSPNQEADVYRFLERYKVESSGPLRLSAPKSVAGHLASSGGMRHIETLIRNAGIDPASTETRRYGGGVAEAAALELSYDRTVAVAPQCADWATNLGQNRERLPFNNFGCATQRNFALNVANARDMQQTREEMPRSSERRSSTWTKYIDQETPQAAVSDAASGAGAKKQ